MTTYMYSAHNTITLLFYISDLVQHPRIALGMLFGPNRTISYCCGEVLSHCKNMGL